MASTMEIIDHSLALSPVSLSSDKSSTVLFSLTNIYMYVYMYVHQMHGDDDDDEVFFFCFFLMTEPVEL